MASAMAGSPIAGVPVIDRALAGQRCDAGVVAGTDDLQQALRSESVPWTAYQQPEVGVLRRRPAAGYQKVLGSRPLHR